MQITLIVLVQRYNTFWSLGLLAWVLLTGFTNNKNHLRALLLYLAFPCLMAIYGTLIYANLNSPKYRYYDPENTTAVRLGFQLYPHFWLESLVCNFSFLLFIGFIRSVDQFNQRLEEARKRRGKRFGKPKRRKNLEIVLDKQTGQMVVQRKEASWGTIFLAIILRYTFFVSLSLLFTMGLMANNLINFVLFLLFLLYLCNLSTLVKIEKRVPVESADRQDKAGLFETKQIEVDFMYKYWIVEVVLLALIILAKYVFWFYYTDSGNSEWDQLYEWIGISARYSFDFNLGLRSGTDYANESLYLVLFFFSALQQHVYKSVTYRRYSFRISSLIQQKSFVQRNFPNFESFTKHLTILYYLMLIWVSLIEISTSLVVLQAYSLINTAQIVLQFALSIYYLLNNSRRDKEFDFERFRFVWKFLLGLQVFLVVVRYVLQFTYYEFVRCEVLGLKKDPTTGSCVGGEKFQEFQSYRSFVGLYAQITPNGAAVSSNRILQTFTPSVSEIYFAILTLDFLKVISQGYQRMQTYTLQ